MFFFLNFKITLILVLRIWILSLMFRHYWIFSSNSIRIIFKINNISIIWHIFSSVRFSWMILCFIQLISLCLKLRVTLFRLLRFLIILRLSWHNIFHLLQILILHFLTLHIFVGYMLSNILSPEFFCISRFIFDNFIFAKLIIINIFEIIIIPHINILIEIFIVSIELLF